MTWRFDSFDTSLMPDFTKSELGDRNKREPYTLFCDHTAATSDLPDLSPTDVDPAERLATDLPGNARFIVVGATGDLSYLNGNHDLACPGQVYYPADAACDSPTIYEGFPVTKTRTLFKVEETPYANPELWNGSQLWVKHAKITIQTTLTPHPNQANVIVGYDGVSSTSSVFASIVWRYDKEIVSGLLGKYYLRTHHATQCWYSKIEWVDEVERRHVQVPGWNAGIYGIVYFQIMP